jgi:hypothetical protein
MELSELKTVWQAYNSRLEKSLKLNFRCLEMLQAQKIKSKLSLLLWQRIVEAVLDILLLFWLAGFLVKNITQWPYAFFSLALILFYLVTLINCLRQIITIKHLDYSDDLITIQSSLVLLQTHLVNYLRLIFLIVPFWLAFPVIFFKAFLHFDILSKLHGDWWAGQIIFSVLLLPGCIWLYMQLSYKNIHKPWVNFVIQKTSGAGITRAFQFVKELEELREGHEIHNAS